MTVNTKAFERVLAWLDKGAPHEEARGMSFEMRSFIRVPVTSSTDENWCGTACCIAGAALTLNDTPKLLDAVKIATKWLKEWNWDEFDLNSGLSLWDDAKDLLGLTNKEASMLFAPWEQGSEEIDSYNQEIDVGCWPEDPDEITPAWAAATIRYFLATGSIRWDVTNPAYAVEGVSEDV